MTARTLGSKRDGLLDPTSLREVNEAFFIRVWKPLPIRCVLKILRESLKGKAQRGQHLRAVGLDRCKEHL